jgi:predicted ATPase
MEMKGLAEPVQAWQVLHASSIESRFEALHSAALTPLVGREEELDLLFRRWRRATSGEGQVVLLSGEPGIGKSRIIVALQERLVGEPHLNLRHFCSPYGAASALYPIITRIERAAGFEREDGPGARRAKLQAFLAGTATSGQDIALLMDLLSIEGDGASLGLSPHRKKENTLGALLRQLEALARQQPLLVIFEDLHWIDPTSRELIDHIVDRVQSLPVLLLLTYRSEFDAAWSGRPHVTTMALSRLARREAVMLVEKVTGAKPLPPDIVAQVVARTDGVPLFAEELTRAVIESSIVRDAGDRYVLDGPLPARAIPSTLHASLLARLDRLAPVREVAQIGAAIGREFSYELLAAVVPLEEAPLQEALTRLTASGLVFGRGTPPDAVYAFKHALVQDAVYETLLRSRRHELHARIARVLENDFAETAETQPELLAHHLTEAGLAREAIDGWLKAGQLAARRSAMHEAVAHLGRALDLLKTLPDDAERRRCELALQLSLGPALVAAKGFAVPETVKVYARACELARQAEDGTAIFAALYGQWVVQFNQQLAAAHEVAGELLCLARDREDVAAEVTGHRAVGSTFFKLGRLTEGRGHLESGLALYDPVRDRNSGYVYAYDSSSVCASWLSHALLVMGYPDQARARAAEALAHARIVAHPNTLALTLGCGCSLYQLVRDGQKARSQAEDAIAITSQEGFPYWLAVATIIRGWTLVETSQGPAGGIEIRQGLNLIRRLGSVTVLPYFLGLSAEAHGKTRQFATGLGLLEEALSWVERTGESWFLAELHRLRGELLLASRQPGPAEACFRDAIAAARTQGARWWELRAASSLARLQSGEGRRREARELLAPIYDWFTEGVDTPDVVEARALLDDLA